MVIIPPRFSISRDSGVAPKEEDVHNIAGQYASSGITPSSDEGRLISVCVVNRRWWLGRCVGWPCDHQIDQYQIRP